MIERASTQAQLTDPDGRINNGSWQGWFQKFDDYYNRILKWTDPDNIDFGKREPDPKFTGMLAYADGTNWDPISLGAGFYRYTGSAWIACPPYEEPPHVPEWTVVDNVQVLNAGTQTSWTAIDCSSAIPDGTLAVYGIIKLYDTFTERMSAQIAPNSDGTGSMNIEFWHDSTAYLYASDQIQIDQPFFMAIKNPAATAIYYKSVTSKPQVTINISGYFK
jgi:hypothetical protein